MMTVGHLDPFMVRTIAAAEYYRRLEIRARAVARGEATSAEAAQAARLWDAIVALAEETLVVAGHRRLSEIPVPPERAAAELRRIADRERASWEREGRPAGARRHTDLAELARLIADLPRRVALETERTAA